MLQDIMLQPAGYFTFHALRWLCPAAFFALMLAFSGGCSTGQVHATIKYQDISLRCCGLETKGLGFLTPSTVTGQEQDIQSLAFIFASQLEKQRPDIRVVSLPEVLSAVNQAGMADEYKQMYVDYSDTGIFKQESLRKVGQTTGVHYLAQLKLSSFNQGSSNRFSFLGLRLLQTKEANIRLFLQIWNSEMGSIVWEGTAELNYAKDTTIEKPVTFKLVVEEIAENLINKLPVNGVPHSAKP